jgi:hypothetical protein
MSKRKKHRPDMRKVARGGAGIKELGMSNLLNSQPKAINATVPDSDEQPTTLVRGAAVNARAAMTAQSTVRSLDLDAIGGVGHSRRDDGLPKDIARSIIESASKLGNVRQNVPLLPDEEVTRLITENPEVALEGLTKLGRVMRIPTKRATTSGARSTRWRRRPVSSGTCAATTSTTRPPSGSAGPLARTGRSMGRCPWRRCERPCRWTSRRSTTGG